MSTSPRSIISPCLNLLQGHNHEVPHPFPSSSPPSKLCMSKLHGDTLLEVVLGAGQWLSDEHSIGVVIGCVQLQ